MAETLKREPPGIEARLDPEVVVEQFPGPACIVDAERRPEAPNALWGNVGLPGSADDGPLPIELATGLLALFHTGRPQRFSLTVAGQQGSSIQLDVTCLPCTFADHAGALVLASDRSATELVQAALAEGREFHRGLALCSSDATFEIDQWGRFTYVGPTGFLGYADFELHGLEIRNLICERCRNSAEFVLTSREAIGDAELWFTGHSGEEQCFVLSAMPYFDSEGEWAGLRAAGREVTGQRTLEAEVRRARRAQQRIDAVLHAMRTEARPSSMIAAGVAALLESIDVEACFVAHANDEGFDRIEAYAEADFQEGAGRPPAPDAPSLLDLCTHICGRSDGAIRSGEVDGFSVVIAPTRYGGDTNGAVGCLRINGLRGGGGTLWSEEDRHLVRSISGQMSVAIAQLDLFERASKIDAA